MIRNKGNFSKRVIEKNKENSNYYYFLKCFKKGLKFCQYMMNEQLYILMVRGLITEIFLNDVPWMWCFIVGV